MSDSLTLPFPFHWDLWHCQASAPTARMCWSEQIYEGFWFCFDLFFSLHSGNFSSAASFRWQDICEHMQIEQSLNFGGLFLGLRWLIVEVGVDEKQVRALPLSPQAASSTTHWAKAILNPIPSSAPLAHHSLSFQACSSLPSASRDPSPSVCLTFPENAQIWKV